MRSLIFLTIAIIFALIISCVCPAAADTTSKTVLPNGMKLIICEGHNVNLVAIDIWVRAGSINESAENCGVSHFVEHMVFKATKKYGPGQIDREMEGVGAEVNGGTSKDYVHFYTTVASEYLGTALDVLSDAITNAQFRQEDMDKERRVVLDEIAGSDSDPSKVAVNLFARTAYGSHPYGRPAVGTRESVMRLKREDLLSYYSKYYNPENTCVVVAGDVNPKDAEAAVVRAFKDFKSTRGKAHQDDLANQLPERKSPELHRYTWQKSSKNYMVVGFPIPACSDNESCSLDVTASVLGDTYRGKLSSALNAAQVHFTGISCDYVSQRYSGLFYVLVSVEPADAEKAASVIVGEFRKIASGSLTKPEVDNAKSRVEGYDLYDQETISGEARFFGLYETVASLETAENRTSLIRGLNVADITKCAEKYLAGENYCLVTLEPENSTSGASQPVGRQ